MLEQQVMTYDGIFQTIYDSSTKDWIYQKMCTDAGFVERYIYKNNIAISLEIALHRKQLLTKEELKKMDWLKGNVTQDVYMIDTYICYFGEYIEENKVISVDDNINIYIPVPDAVFDPKYTGDIQLLDHEYHIGLILNISQIYDAKQLFSRYNMYLREFGLKTN